ncbi:MAG: ORF6N domain-containing protein [Candidatus Margulisiibacteriota bacterium]
MNNLLPEERIERRILVIRGQKVMLDRDLAELYGVSTKRLNEQVKRNIRRFPADFMFQLTKSELIELVANCDRFKIYEGDNSRSQNATLKQGHNLKYFPYVFTEQGVAMLSSVLNSEKAIDVNIIIMRTFVKLKNILSTHKELAHKFKELEARMDKSDEKIFAIFEAIKQLMTPPEKPKRRMGFIAGRED